jgi:chromosome segregation ATPase
VDLTQRVDRLETSFIELSMELKTQTGLASNTAGKVELLNVRVDHLTTTIRDAQINIDRRLDSMEAIAREANDRTNQLLVLYNGLDDRVSQLQTDMAEVKSDITSIKSEITGMKSDITGIKSEMTSMKAEIAEVKSVLYQILDRLPANS